jgi:hypothetical protein
VDIDPQEYLSEVGIANLEKNPEPRVEAQRHHPAEMAGQSGRFAMPAISGMK